MKWFDRVRRTQLERLELTDPRQAEWLRGQGGIYLFGTIGSEAVLLSDGTVRFWSAEDSPDSEEYVEREPNDSERIGALVLGARRIPEVKELLPIRRDGDPDCATCHGSGDILGGVVCYTCGGVGWVRAAI